MSEENKPKQHWLKLYSLVLIANAIYIVAFYLLMKAI